MRRLPIATLVAALALAIPFAGPHGDVSDAAAASGLVAHLYVHSHHPKAGAKWPIRITAHDAHGHRARARVRYALIYGGQVVKRIDPHNGHFLGEFIDAHYAWPKTTIDLDLTFRAIVDSHLGQANLDYAVKVQR
jgi:hypothetical protein